MCASRSGLSTYRWGRRARRAVALALGLLTLAGCSMWRSPNVPSAARGERIAFSTDAHDTNDTMVLQRATGTISQLTAGAYNEWVARWSPDGAQLAYVSQRDGNAEAYRMAADGSDQTRVTHHPGEDESPCWSPDGQQLAFATERAGNWDIYTIQADGTAEAAVVATSANEIFPAWTH